MPEVLRLAQTIRLKPECLDEYVAIHNQVWPSVLKRISASNIRDYSIFYDRETSILTATMKYVGDDYEGDMKRMAEDPETQRWWHVTDKMQETLNEDARSSVEGGKHGWWKRLEEVFYVA